MSSTLPLSMVWPLVTWHILLPFQLHTVLWQGVNSRGVVHVTLWDMECVRDCSFCTFVFRLKYGEADVEEKSNSSRK